MTPEWGGRKKNAEIGISLMSRIKKPEKKICCKPRGKRGQAEKGLKYRLPEKFNVSQVNGKTSPSVAWGET